MNDTDKEEISSIINNLIEIRKLLEEIRDAAPKSKKTAEVFSEEQTKGKTSKKTYGTYNHVRLTDEEYDRLCNDYGQSKVQQAIDFFDAYIEEKGYKCKSHNLAMRRWVFDAVKDNNKAKNVKSVVDEWANA